MIAVGDSTGELAYANKRFLDFLGMTIEELSVASLQTIHPDDRERSEMNGYGAKRSDNRWTLFSA